MKRNTFVLIVTGLVLFILIACGNRSDQPAPNTLTPEEKAEGWELLFNGKNLDGFHILPGG